MNNPLTLAGLALLAAFAFKQHSNTKTNNVELLTTDFPLNQVNETDSTSFDIVPIEQTKTETDSTSFNIVPIEQTKTEQIPNEIKSLESQQGGGRNTFLHVF